MVDRKTLGAKEESRTAIGLTPLLFDLADYFHDFIHGLSPGRALPAQSFKACFQRRPFGFLLAAYEIPHYVAGGGKARFCFASFQPGHLAGSERDVERLSHHDNIRKSREVGKIRQAAGCD